MLSIVPRANPKTQQGKITGEAILLSAAVAAVALRFLARYRTRMKLWWDDWFALLAVILFSGQCGMLFWASNEGLRTIDLKTMTLKDIGLALKLVFVGVYMMGAIITAARFSVIFLYWRLFNMYPTFRKCLYAVTIAGIAWFITVEVLNTFRCTPIGAAWDPLNQKACIGLNTPFIPIEVFHCVLDFILVTMPIFRVKELHLSFRDRIAVSAVFLTGTFTSATSILRIVFVHNQSQIQSAFWLSLQLSFHIIAACLPTLRTFLPSREISRPTVSSLFSSVLRREEAPESSGKASNDSDSDKSTTRINRIHAANNEKQNGGWGSSAV